jgi:uncharacterized protein (DUF427 family)
MVLPVIGLNGRMNPGHTITITPTDVHVEVRVDGTLVAASDRPLVLEETGLPARYYLPRDDVRMDLFHATSFSTTCPFKGDASYWTLELDGTSHDGIAWSYETPLERSAAIAGLVSFYNDRVDLTVRDDTPVGS